MKLQSLFDTYRDSVYHKDVDSFLSIFDNNLKVFDMWGQFSIEGLPAWRKMAEGWFGSLGSERVVVEFEDQHETVTPELAYLSAITTFRAVSAEGKELRSLQNRLTWVAKKQGADWKIIHEHTSGPVDHETMKVILKRSR